MRAISRQVSLTLVLFLVASGAFVVSSDVAAAAGNPPLLVQLGYADGTRASSANFPNPWAGSPGVKFLGCQPPSPCTYDGGAVRIINTSTKFLEIIRTVAVHIGNCTYSWSPYATSAAELQPGQSLIVTQLSSGSPFFGGCTGPDPTYFDGSDVGPGGSSYAGQCTPDSIIPTVDITLGNKRTTTYRDFGQVLNTHGYDVAACPSGTNESIPWTSGINEIQHIVVVIQENHSADNYLGQLYTQGQPAYTAEPNSGNPNPLGGAPLVPFRKLSVCETHDVNHSWNGAHIERNGGRMNDFAFANSASYPSASDPDYSTLTGVSADAPSDPLDPSGSRTMGYFDASSLPYYNTLFNTFATGDHFFSSLLGGTHPNRFYLYAATSFGWIRNLGPLDVASNFYFPFPQPTIFGKLQAAGISWKYYYGGTKLGMPGTAANFFEDVRANSAKVVPLSQYYTDLQNNTLPQVSYIDPTFTDLGNDPNVATDEHPPSSVQVGQKYAYNLIKALGQSSAWATSAMFLTYDEGGGYYDHVPPPEATPPDNIAPDRTLPVGTNPFASFLPGSFNRFGYRVPVVVVSPFAKAHFVSHHTRD